MRKTTTTLLKEIVFLVQQQSKKISTILSFCTVQSHFRKVGVSSQLFDTKCSRLSRQSWLACMTISKVMIKSDISRCLIRHQIAVVFLVVVIAETHSKIPSGMETTIQYSLDERILEFLVTFRAGIFWTISFCLLLVVDGVWRVNFNPGLPGILSLTKKRGKKKTSCHIHSEIIFFAHHSLLRSWCEGEQPCSRAQQWQVGETPTFWSLTVSFDRWATTVAGVGGPDCDTDMKFVVVAFQHGFL